MEYSFYYLLPQILFFVSMGGFILGRVFFRTIELKTRYLWNYLITGWAFILLLFLVSIFSFGAIEMNPRWVEAGMLFALYIAFIALGNHRFRG